MKHTLEWVKGNVLIVVLGVVAIGSLVAGWMISASMSAAAREKLEGRVKKISELSAIEKANISLALPGKEPTSLQVVINQSVLDQYKEITGQLKSDADAVHKLTLERNRRDHKPVLADVFPQPRADKKDVIAFTLHKEIMAAYESLLNKVKAGMPPPPQQIAENLARRDSQFIEATLKKASRAALDEKELAQLTADLTRSRLALYGEQAQKVSVYASLDALDLPAAPEKKPSLGQLFDWQWKYWLTKDILEAIADASAKSGGGSEPASVLKSPVKRVLSIRIPDMGFAKAASSGTQGAFGGLSGGFSGGDSAAPATPAPEATAATLAAAPVIDFTQEAPRDYKVSFTGRGSNQIYDVRSAKVTLIVETARLPELFDALARRNFMTVLDSTVRPADPFAAANDGFIYGKAHVSEVTLTIESVWLREWTVPYMPLEVRTALGISSGAPDPSAAPAG
jgi:hypothetical protein